MTSPEAQPEPDCHIQPVSRRTSHDFKRLLLRSLREHGIRYVAFSSQNHSAEAEPGRLNLAMPCEDECKWPDVIKSLSAHAYLPIRSVYSGVKVRRYDFAWVDLDTMSGVAVYVTSHRRREQPLKTKRSEWPFRSRNPIHEISRLVDNAYRQLRGWIQPTGMFVVALGPDGAGKSTVIKHLVMATQPAFGGSQLFHWRPASLWPRKHVGNVTDPHGQVPHSAWWSIARILSHILDYWFGYLTKIRPALARSQLVVFDRYFYDLIVDRRRYRYNGPQWLLSALTPFVPKPDLVFILDASEEKVLSRKQELDFQEVRRQRKCYGQLAGTLPNAELVQADQELRQVVDDASQSVVRLLVKRFYRYN